MALSVADARAKARTRIARSYAGWIVGESAVLDLPLHVPSQADVLRDQAAARAWVASWEGVAGVVWGTRSWASAGTQRVPERLVLSGAAEIAAFAGGAESRTWRAALASADAVRGVLGVSADADGGAEGVVRADGRAGAEGVVHADERARVESVVRADERAGAGRRSDGSDTELPSTADLTVNAALRSNAARLATLTPAEATRVARAALWLRANPAAGLRIRQVPIPGVDTKWLAQHKGLLAALLGGPLGLATVPENVRMRVLDEMLWPEGPRTMLAPASEWDRVPLRPSVVLIVENLETLLALPSLPGVVAVHGSGYGTWARLQGIGWLVDAPRLLYWGDLDSHGFGVLNEVRAACPRVASVLMDAETLLAHREVWEVEPRPAAAVLTHLRDDEQAVRDLLASLGDVRLEQERVLWPWVLERVVRAVA